MSDYQNNEGLKNLKLGQVTEYQSQYAPELLQAVPRQLNREELGIVESQPFVGYDVWHAYELSWLNLKGKPVVALARCIVDATSPNIIESKSFKLYLNSFNQTRFKSNTEVHETMVNDLSTTAGGEVFIELFKPDDNQVFQIVELEGVCIDDIDISVDEFELNPDLLKMDPSNQRVSETVHSHLLKSNCLITNQPDWASIVIQYKGKKIDHESLLKYLISFRMHNEFHEQCVERIFMDIQRLCSSQELSVQALYTRRGGLDINPFRCLKNNSKYFNKSSIARINRQ
jgi:7-cyano-7-deazaguanine reductase